MRTFKVGDVCVGQNFTVDTYRNGVECEIIEGLGLRHWAKSGWLRSGEVYVIRWADGEVKLCWPEKLRLKKPPAREIDTIVKWEDCLWQPKEAFTKEPVEAMGWNQIITCKTRGELLESLGFKPSPSPSVDIPFDAAKVQPLNPGTPLRMWSARQYWAP